MSKPEKINYPTQVKHAPPGRHRAGDGLYLIVNPPRAGAKKGSRQWMFLFTSPARGPGGKALRRGMGLGTADSGGMTLAEARARAVELRREVLDGRDPIAEREAVRRKAAAQAAAPKALTFGAYADEWLRSNDHAFRNPKHRAQWHMTLNVYAAPLRGKLLTEVNTEHVLEALQPIWLDKPETAKRTRGRIERILDAAKVRGLRSGENPARWRGHLAHLLPKHRKPLDGSAHHAAMPYKDVPGFIQQLRQRQGIAARALEFAVLTAVRSGEVRGMTWAEVDLEAKCWTVPAARMKAGREHNVPLSERAFELLAEARQFSDGSGLVFPGQTKGTPMSDMTLTAVLRRMKIANATVHGFRSAFRDWAAETTSFDRDTCEMALAHAVAGKVEAAYRRGDLFNKRVKLMEAWCRFSTDSGTSVDNVVKLSAA